MQGLRWLILFCCAVVTAPSPAAAVHADHSHAELVAEVTQAAPGQSFTLALTITPREHWHLYWKNPGDSGARIITAWSAPAGVTIGNPRWPVPTRIAAGPLMNYGYDGPTTWLYPVTLPDDAGGTVALHLDAEWLVCDVECVPQFGEFRLSIPVAGRALRNAAVEARIRRARATLPAAQSPWPVKARRTAGGSLLRLRMPAREAALVEDAYFFAAEHGLARYAAEQPLRVEADTLTLEIPAPTGAGRPTAVRGVLLLRPAAGPGEAFEIDVPLTSAAASAGSALPTWQVVLLALLGGVVLNVMPCVFPILSLKALSLAKLAGERPGSARVDGLGYTAGVVVSFLAVGAVLVALKAGGTAAGWGFQLQSPGFVLAMAVLMFAIGLNLMGFYELRLPGSGIGQGLSTRPGLSGAFFTGVLATLVASPCTAPFMATALGAALTLPAALALLVFATLGLGMALPYLAISQLPALRRAMPAPGPWMVRFRQLLAFPLFATAIWLLWVLGLQSGIDAVALALSVMVALAFLIWSAAQFSRPVTALLAVALALGGGLLIDGTALRGGEPAERQGLRYETFSKERLAQLRASGAPVFVNFTAAWCITCQVNERVALSTAAVVDYFDDNGIRALKADWTNRDAGIAALLADHGRSGVPLYLFFRPGATAPILLPQILTPDLVIGNIGN